MHRSATQNDLPRRMAEDDVTPGTPAFASYIEVLLLTLIGRVKALRNEKLGSAN